jgi:MFS family permease
VFPRLIAARTLSILGDRVSEVAIPLAIILMHRPVWLAGAVTACLFAPAPLLGIRIGSIADRYPRRSLLMTADGGRLLIYLALGPLLWVGSSAWNIAGVIVLAFAAGVLDALFGAALNGYIAGAVPTARLMRANSYLETADASATLAGPALSGVILQSLSIIGSMAINAASYAMSLVLFALGPADEPVAAEAEAHDGRLAGLSEIIGQPAQRLLQLGYVYMHLLAGVAGLTVTFYAVRELHFDAARTGFLLAGSGVGGLVASLVMARFTERWPWGAALGISVLASAVGLGVLLIARGFLVAITGVAILDCSSASCFILAISARQAMTPSAVIGRVTASSAMITGVVRGSAAVSFGFLLNYFGATTMIWVLVVITIPAGLWLCLARPGRVLIADTRADEASSSQRVARHGGS